jgi:hypothetical protein
LSSARPPSLSSRSRLFLSISWNICAMSSRLSKNSSRRPSTWPSEGPAGGGAGSSVEGEGEDSSSEAEAEAEGVKEEEEEEEERRHLGRETRGGVVKRGASSSWKRPRWSQILCFMLYGGGIGR